MRAPLPFFVIAAFLLGCGRKEKAMTWSDPLDPIAMTTASVASKAKPVLLVIHEEGHGGWQFMDGGDVTGTKPHVIPKEELLKLDPTLKEVTDLPVDWEGRRSSASSPWVRRKR
jgi:hypothetical protein